MDSERPYPVKIFNSYPFIIELTIGLISSLILLFSTSRYGIGWTPDSVYYMEISENIWNGIGFYYNNGNPYVMYGPLYSMIISLSNIIGMDPFLYTRILNAIVYGILLGLLARWFRKTGTDKTVLILGILMIIGSRPILKVSSMMWSELLFIFFSSIFLLEMGKYLYDPERYRREFGIATAAVMFACLMRYIGITLVITGGILILVRGKTIKRKLLDSSLFGILSCTPTGFYVLRNLWITGTLLGDRYPSNRSFYYVTVSLFRSISNLFIPDILPKVFLFLVSFPMIIILTYIIISAWKMSSKRSQLRYYLYPCLLFTLIYSTYLYISSLSIGFDIIGGRFISPIYVPLLLMILIFISLFFGTERKDLPFKNRILNIPIVNKKFIKISILTISIGMILSTVYIAGNSYMNSPGGLSDPRWSESDTLEYILENKPDGKLYTNVPTIFYNTELYDKVHFVPRKTYQASDEAPDDLTGFNRTLELREYVIFIWFDFPPSYIYPLEEFRDMYDLEEIKVLDDGTVFKVTLPSGSNDRNQI